MTPFFALVRKDLRIFCADRKALIMYMAVPIVIGSFFGYIMGGQSQNSSSGKMTVLLADQDNSAVSRAIAARMAEEPSLSVQNAQAAAAREAVRKGKASAAFVIPAGFGHAASRALFDSSSKPEITVLVDPSRSSEAAMAKGVLTGAVMQAVSKEAFSGEGSRELSRENLARLDQAEGLRPELKDSLRALWKSVDAFNAAESASGDASPFGQGMSAPFSTRTQEVTARQGQNYNAYAHSFAGMSVQFVLFLGIDVGVALLLQRQRGMWKRLRAAPLSRLTVLGSRGVSAALISMGVLVFVFAFARVAFHVTIDGSVPGFFLLCAAFSLMTAMFGLLIAALGSTPEATRGIAIMCTLLMVMLGGAWMPSFLFPKWLQTLTVAVPTRWAVDGLDGVIWRGMTFTGALPQVGLLLAAAVVCGALAVWRFGWED